MKTPASLEGGRGTERAVRETGPHAFPLPFTLIELTAVNFGSKLAIGKIEIPGLGVLNVEFFKPTNKPAFAEAESIRNRYTGQYERSVQLDADFAEELLHAIECRLVANDNGAD